MMKPIVFN